MINPKYMNVELQKNIETQQQMLSEMFSGV